MGRQAPIISHNLFADDSLFSIQDTPHSVDVIQEVLENYAQVSGQLINKQKSGIYFSKNFQSWRREQILQQLGMQHNDGSGKYLGMPFVLGRTKTQIFAFLTNRLWKKANGWKEKLLSKGGKEVLVKAVLQAIPTYLMSLYAIPKKVINDMVKIIRNFWWRPGRKEGMHWISWQKICKMKHQGGLGFKHLENFNLALLAKQGWRLIHNTSSLAAQVLKAKYFPRVDFMEAKCGPSASFLWRSIIKGRMILQQGLRWRIGSGDSVRAFHDPWLPVPTSFKPITYPSFMHHSLMVSDLILNGQWQEYLVRVLFTQRDSDLILAIPINPLGGSDTRIWHYTPHGRFTVSSAYRVANASVEMILTGS